MGTLSEQLKRRLFWVVAHTCFTLYRWFPIFGPLRASIAIIHRDNRFLVVQRNDGRGVSLPGGISGRGEQEEKTLRREVQEETGLEVQSLEVKLRYHSTADVPCNIVVFEVQAEGELKGSWEGSPRWMSLPDLEPRLLESQRPALDLMKRLLA